MSCHDNRINARNSRQRLLDAVVHSSASLHDQEFMNGTACMRHRHFYVGNAGSESYVKDVSEVHDVGVDSIKLVIQNTS